MKQEEKQIPENYVSGGGKSLNKAVKSNFLEISFILIAFVWLGTALVISFLDIFDGFQHPWLTTTFIIGSVVGIYLKTKDYIKTKKPFFSFINNRKKGCDKCGKNKTKK